MKFIKGNFQGSLLLITGIIIFNTLAFAQFKVVGYYPQWLSSTLPPENIKFENLTHIIHAFAWPDSLGEISMYSGMPDTGLINTTHKAGKKILLALGGWGQSYGFAPMSADSLRRENFINNVVELFMQYEYDGIDIDWEFPESTDQGKNLTTLIKELRERFDQENPDWLISMAVSSGSLNGQYSEYDKLVEYIDWFSMMGYDFHGNWTTHCGHNAPLYQPLNCSDGAVDNGVAYLTDTSLVPKEKILMGVPFYGKEYNAAGLYEPFTGYVNDLLYKEIAPRVNSGDWEYYWDDFSKVPYLLNSELSKFIAYDDTMSIRIKCNYVSVNQLAGVMIWALGQDIISGSQPLLETIGKTLGLVTPAKTSDDPLRGNFYLYNNYPNPFNPNTSIRFSIEEREFILLKIYDVLGNEIVTLVNEEKPAGVYEVKFYSENLSSGIYFYQLTAGEFSSTKRMMILK